MDKNVFVHLRLMPHVDESIRAIASHKGELSKTVEMALKEADLRTIPLVEMRLKEGVCSTVVILPKRLYASVKNRAAERGVSINCLINSAIKLYTERVARSSDRR